MAPWTPANTDEMSFRTLSAGHVTLSPKDDLDGASSIEEVNIWDNVANMSYA